MNPFEPSCQPVLELTNEWEPRLLSLSENMISNRTNSQNRTVRQILGHLVDSASNNTHRIIHLQYRESPCSYPNYAPKGTTIAGSPFRTISMKTGTILYSCGNIATCTWCM